MLLIPEECPAGTRGEGACRARAACRRPARLDACIGVKVYVGERRLGKGGARRCGKPCGSFRPLPGGDPPRWHPRQWQRRMTVHAAQDIPRISVSDRDGDCRIVVEGPWTIRNSEAMEQAVGEFATPRAKTVRLDLSQLKGLDTAGAWLIHRLQADIEFHGGAGRANGRAQLLRGSYRRGRAAPPAGLEAGAPPPVAAWHPGEDRARGRRCRRRHQGRAAYCRLAGQRAVRCLPAPSKPAPGVRCDPVRPGLHRRGADRAADELPDRGDHFAAGRVLPAPVRRRHLCGRSRRRAGAARDRRHSHRDHGRGPLRLGLHRRDRLDEDARGDRRAACHRPQSDGNPDPAAPVRPDPCPAGTHLSVQPGGVVRRRAGELDLSRHRAARFHRPDAGGCYPSIR